jgi:hypothetical protein
MSDTELKAQLARTEQALLEAEKEIDRQRRAAAAEAEIPEGAKALIAAVSKVDLPAFWDAGFASASQPSAEPALCPQVSSLTTWLASCPTPFLSPAAPSCCLSISKTRMPTRD